MTDTAFPSALPAPRFPNPRDAPVLRWGILAPGQIATDFTTALNRHTDQRVVAVGSRSAERAAVFAQKLGIERSYGSYQQLVDDPDLDVVYIAPPHAEHAELTLLAISAGKNVLVEKPLAITADDARRIAEAASDAGVFAMEAMWTRYLPHTDVARQLLADGVLGEIGVVSADFGSSASFDPTHRLFDAAAGGGALLDLGIYPVSFSQFALGSIRSVFASGSLAPTGVDDQAVLVLGAENGGQALLSTSLRVSTPSAASIAGTRARIDVAPPFWSPSDLTLTDARGATLTWRDASGIRGRDGLCYEAAALTRYVTEGRTESPLHPLDEAIAALNILDEARRMVGYGSV